MKDLIEDRIEIRATLKHQLEMLESDEIRTGLDIPSNGESTTTPSDRTRRLDIDRLRRKRSTHSRNRRTGRLRCSNLSKVPGWLLRPDIRIPFGGGPLSNDRRESRLDACCTASHQKLRASVLSCRWECLIINYILQRSRIRSRLKNHRSLAWRSMTERRSASACCVLGVTVMRTFHHLENLPLGPEDIKQMTAAYEQALHKIGLIDRTDPRSEIIAKKIIEVVQTGERNPARISRRALLELGIPTAPIRRPSRPRKSAA